MHLPPPNWYTINFTPKCRPSIHLMSRFDIVATHCSRVTTKAQLTVHFHILQQLEQWILYTKNIKDSKNFLSYLCSILLKDEIRRISRQIFIFITSYLQKTSVLPESANPIPHAWIGLKEFDYNLYILSVISKALNSNLVTSISFKVRKCKN